MSFSTGGGTNYQAALDSLFDARFSPQVFRAALQAIGQAMVAQGKSDAPVMTGDLVSKIGSQMVDDYTLEVFSDSDHSAYVNDGTWKMDSNPFFDRMVALGEGMLKQIKL